MLNEVEKLTNRRQGLTRIRLVISHCKLSVVGHSYSYYSISLELFVGFIWLFVVYHLLHYILVTINLSQILQRELVERALHWTRIAAMPCHQTS